MKKFLFWVFYIVFVSSLSVFTWQGIKHTFELDLTSVQNNLYQFIITFVISIAIAFIGYIEFKEEF